jgi:hypothetical protein
MGLLSWVLRPSGLTHSVPPFLLFESISRGTHGTKARQQPQSALQMSFGLKNSNLPPTSKFVECSVLSRIIG